jgi:hypothetical protein
MKTTLPTGSAERKNHPLLSGALRYAPAAISLMAKTSKEGNDKHNPGQELHHARGKSADHGDCAVRHLMDVQDILATITRGEDPDTDEALRRALAVELGQLAWRANLYVQEIAEKYLGYPLAPGARLPVQEPKPGTVSEVCGHVSVGRVCTKEPGHRAFHGNEQAIWHNAKAPR